MSADAVAHFVGSTTRADAARQGLHIHPPVFMEETKMLVLSRCVNQAVKIGENVEVLVVSVAGGKVRLGINAPRDVQIVRDDAVKTDPPTQDP